MNTTDTWNGKFIIALSRSLQIIHRKSEKLFLDHHLTMAQFAVLEALYHKGDVTIKSLMESVLSTSGNMTVVLRNLEKQKLILRTENPQDKRSYIISLTQQGLEVIAPLFKRHMLYVEESLANLEEVEKQEVLRILKKIERR